jgi:lipopolysaccharide/colanic/teichoic acid biosynthesis glycosyltransferase
MLIILCEDGRPFFFVQQRVGLNGRIFPFYKFRSMVKNAEQLKDQLARQNESGDGVIFKMKRDPRITRIGGFLRRFSVDEFPQFFNVLKGDLAIVGPRPPVPREVAQYTLEDRKRLHVKPGLTCLWQIQGRSEIPFKEQVRLDLQYIRSQSLRKDLMIMLKTVPAVLLGRGAY